MAQQIDDDLEALRSDIGQMRAEFPPLDGMTPELRQRAFHLFQSPRQLRLAAPDRST